MLKIFAGIGKILAAMIGIRIGAPGMIASLFLFFWALSDFAHVLEIIAG